MSQTIPSLVTVADMSRAFNVPEATLRRILRHRGICPTARAGNVGVFDGDSVAQVRHAVNSHRTRQAEGGASDEG